MEPEAHDDDDVVTSQVAIPAQGPVRAALDGRADILSMTRKAHDAALRPAKPGGLSHAVRAALAARAARLHGEESLAVHYRSLMAAANAGGDVEALADPAATNVEDRRLAAFAAYTDLASTAPRDATEADIAALWTAGICDADIVRLAELTAFLAYQFRVVAGLKLMQATA